MSNKPFEKFSQAVNARYVGLASGAKEIYVSSVSPSLIWDTYLSAFPEGTDPIYIKETTHTCSCCRNFIQHLGNLVFIVDGKLQSVWGSLGDLPHPYDLVAKALDDLISAGSIDRVFRTQERSYGNQTTKQTLHNELGAVTGSINWNHFWGHVPAAYITAQAGKIIGDKASLRGVFKRGLDEFSIQDLEEVRQLIKNNQLYRGAEFLSGLDGFIAAKRVWDGLEPGVKEIHAWNAVGTLPSYVLGFRNSVLGSLFVELSKGVSLEQAVRSYESHVAPQNYQRPTALVSERQIQMAKEKVQELGLMDSFARRHANPSDIKISDCLWSGRANIGHAPSDPFAAAAAGVKSSRVNKTVQGQQITLEQFLSEVSPTAKGIELMFDGGMANHLMTLTSPVYPDAPSMFKWNNGFAWSYNGGAADSIKERVSKAGGNVNAKLRASLAWGSFDDYDLHAFCRGSGEHIFYGKRSAFGARLDVDMNGMDRHSETPVENISWTQLVPGEYDIVVKMYSQKHDRRKPHHAYGFTLEIEHKGQVVQITHDELLADAISVATIKISDKGDVVIVPASSSKLRLGGSSADVWGLKSNTWVPVSMITYSPNHWENEGGEGNKHVFFLVNGCTNPDPVRGFYNEFLRGDLNEHRKALELVGAGSKVEPSEYQMSGFGFSETINKALKLRVTSVDGKTRDYEVLV